MSIPSFHTERLKVRPWEAVLADPKTRSRFGQAVMEMLTDPVLEHLPEAMRPGAGPSAAEEWIKAREGSTPIALVENQEALVGLLFLFHPKDAPADTPLHLGYVFGEEAWGKGFASELVAGLMNELDKGPEQMLQAGVSPGNPASARVLEKSGFRLNDALSDETILIFNRTVGATF